MVPISLFIWLVLEIAAYLAIGRNLLQADWAYAWAGAIGGLLGLRAGMVAITWMFGMAFASPATRLGFARTARLMLDDYLAFLLTFLLVIPFERLWMPADRLTPGKHPILLVHGHGVSRGVWVPPRRRPEPARHFVAHPRLPPPVPPTAPPPSAWRSLTPDPASGCRNSTSASRKFAPRPAASR